MSDFLLEKAVGSLVFFSLAIGFSLLASVLFAAIPVGISFAISCSVIDTTFLTRALFMLGSLEDGDEFAHFS